MCAASVRKRKSKEGVQGRKDNSVPFSEPANRCKTTKKKINNTKIISEKERVKLRTDREGERANRRRTRRERREERECVYVSKLL